MQEYIFALVLHAYSSGKEELAYIRFGEEITNLTLWSTLIGFQKKLSSSLRGPINNDWTLRELK